MDVFETIINNVVEFLQSSGFQNSLLGATIFVVAGLIKSLISNSDIVQRLTSRFDTVSSIVNNIKSENEEIISFLKEIVDIEKINKAKMDVIEAKEDMVADVLEKITKNSNINVSEKLEISNIIKQVKEMSAEELKEKGYEELKELGKKAAKETLEDEEVKDIIDKTEGNKKELLEELDAYEQTLKENRKDEKE